MWRVAKSLLVFHAQCRPLAPGADPRTFGTIGDSLHDPTSDHAPHDFPGWGLEIVTAADIPKFGSLKPRDVLDNIRRSRDRRVKYAISEGQMFSSYPAYGVGPWTWRPYAGKDGHFEHGHLSVVGDKRADDERPWDIGDDDVSAETDQIVKFELRPWVAETDHTVGRIEQAVAHLAEVLDKVVDNQCNCKEKTNG